MINDYKNFPYFINPEAFSVGIFSVGWYALMYLVAFSVVYFLLRYRMIKSEGNFFQSAEDIFDFMFYVFLGVIIGGRLGYVLFYNPSFYAHNIFSIISPFDQSGNFIGIYGMSYHGGLVGVIFASWIFCRRRNINFSDMLEFVIPAVPAGYFFGRIGNFLNGELYGRITEKPWGMYFPSDMYGFLRHPSQLYEAFFEGLILFVILWVWRKNPKFEGKLFPIYLIGYAIFRFCIEFLREPDEHIGYFFSFLTLGQILSFLMLVAGIIFIIRRRTKL